MRTLLTFAPAMICVGTMIVCVRMMSGRHHSSDEPHPPIPAEFVDEAEAAGATSRPDRGSRNPPEPAAP
ncbi:MAG: hypothetical protein M3P11_12755 [Actinomycetota bacterium]|nr:hypothetical protein [Actinomycetota bacterium]